MRRLLTAIVLALFLVGCASDEQRPSLGDEAPDDGSSTSVQDTQPPFDGTDGGADTQVIGGGDGTTIVGGGDLGTTTAG